MQDKHQEAQQLWKLPISIIVVHKPKNNKKIMNIRNEHFCVCCTKKALVSSVLGFVL